MASKVHIADDQEASVGRRRRGWIQQFQEAGEYSDLERVTQEGRRARLGARRPPGKGIDGDEMQHVVGRDDDPARTGECLRERIEDELADLLAELLHPASLRRTWPDPARRGRACAQRRSPVL